ncbi:MAG: patatin-like phospholipase family protein [Geminicoccaceae bacterium]
MKRAITLAGGGPAAGLHIGALKRFEEAGITFDVWALSCIGAWVGIIYNQFKRDEKALATEGFFRENIFRDDLSYSRFPINKVFAPDLVGNTKAFVDFLFDPASYQNLVLPEEIMRSVERTMQVMNDPTKWNQGDINNLILDIMSANPATRFMTSMMFLTKVNGLSRIYYKDSSFLKSIKVERLHDEGQPFIYHNAWNLSRKQMALFSNKHEDGYGTITTQTLCACSALPYIEETVEMNGEVYCEGALVQTVNFDQLLSDHPDLEEVWISRIVDDGQVRIPENLYQGLGNLAMLFAANLGKDDVDMFRHHAAQRDWRGRIMELRVSSAVNFDWSHSNLDTGLKAGYTAADDLVRQYEVASAA